VYTADAGGDWGIVAVAPRSRSIVDAMGAQDCRYTVTDLVPGGPTRVVDSIVEALHMRDDADQVIDLLASPSVTVVTLTITEKGYHRRAGRLDVEAPEVAADLAWTTSGTVVGMLARGLAERYRRGGAPLSVISCDNMAGNGKALAGVVRDFVEASHWPDRLLDGISFPDTVVDRIVPATETVFAIKDAAGWDRIPVFGEPYREWVLEDAFAAARPHWEQAGATIVPDVTPHQLRKLRLLNGAHSAIAYLGAAVGCETVADVLATDWGEKFVRGYCAEVAATLAGDQSSYVDALVARFANPVLRHRLSQIGSDGSLKIVERWFGPLREIPATPLLELALAGWVNATRQRFGMTDPAAERLAACWHDNANPVAQLLRVAGAPDLAERTDLVASVAARLPALAAGRVEF
jgi:fructuronate reductase